MPGTGSALAGGTAPGGGGMVTASSAPAVTRSDFTAGLPIGPFDGVLAANSLHFVDRVVPVLTAIHAALRPGGTLVVVEYDADHGNPWVPHPISFARLGAHLRGAGFAEPELLHRVPSRFLGAIYGAGSRRPGVA